MKKLLKISFIFMLIGILLYNTKVFAADSSPMLEYVSKKSTTSDAANFHPENDSIFEYGTTKLYERDLSENDADYSDVYVEKGTFEDNYNIRYYWLHGLNNLIDEYLNSRDYNQIASENTKDAITKTRNAVSRARSELNTFFNGGKDIKDNDASRVDRSEATILRATSAFRNITGYNTYEDYKKLVDEQLVKLEAAEKVANGEDVTDQDIKDMENKYEESIKDIEENDQKKIQEELEKKVDKDKDTVFVMPTGSADVASGIDDMTRDAENFLNGSDTGIIQDEELKKFSDNLYNLLFGLGVVISVIVGSIIGVKLMVAPIEQRAEAKKLLVPYIVGCVIVFGSFGIWKLVVDVMQGI